MSEGMVMIVQGHEAEHQGKSRLQTKEAEGQRLEHRRSPGRVGYVEVRVGRSPRQGGHTGWPEGQAEELEFIMPGVRDINGPGTQAEWLGSNHVCHRSAAVVDLLPVPTPPGAGISLKLPVTLPSVGQALCVHCSHSPCFE